MKVVVCLLLVAILSACGSESDSPADPVAPPVPENKPPIIEVVSELNIDERSIAVISATATDEDGTVASYTWKQESGIPVSIENANTATVSFMAPEVNEDEKLTFSLTVTDNDGGISEALVTVLISNVNELPIIDVVSELNIDERSIAVISATATDKDGTIASYIWKQESGIPVSIENANTATVSFMAPEVNEDEKLTFSLTVTDNDGGISEALVMVLVNKVEPNSINLNVSISNESLEGLSEIQWIVSDEKETIFKTFAQVTTDTLSIQAELIQQTNGEWLGVIKGVPENTELTFESYSVDFAGNQLYHYSEEKSFLGSEELLEVTQIAIEEKIITEEPIDLCKIYTDKDGNLFELEFKENTKEDGTIFKHTGYRKEGEFIWHNHCGPAYSEYYASGLKYRDSYYFEDVEYNNGDISYISYYNNFGFDGEQAKKEINRKDENGEYFLFKDEPSRITYYQSGRVTYKTWHEGDSFGRAFGPDQIRYADVEGNHYTNMWWYNLAQMKTKRKDFNVDGTAKDCIYFNSEGDYEVVDYQCVNEARLDAEYNVNGNIEPIDICNNYIDSDGSVYPITTQESNGYVTTGYTKNNQYIYHNECSAAMTRFYESGNAENSWVFISGINTNPEGFTSTGYYDAVDSNGNAIKRMDSKIENGFYVIYDDKPSVIKYFTNGDVQYRSWMKTTPDGKWVYGRDIGPDIINYSYGNNGYQQKDLYWYDEESNMLKRKYYDDEGNKDFCAYYLDGDSYVDNMCENEQLLDEEYKIN
ncbi:Ig-like domain-containing protein [Shewanella intestini]|uniref:Cadherin domain-containing protein n=1 Tax=Shewanella intestini TaxID=2017544 RepID=A0ABS5I5F0_9GAMM|nr:MULTISPECIES: hypothetical protein [Shewanella]MBR9729249.1 hypothetical protein [Shewanella intestini]MRG35394.1 hypothetical protein [Shewanella sp. XMDDZSB0408]